MKPVLLPLVGLVWVLGNSPLCAQVGNNNPAGQAGIFNGQVGACGYDPFTGNATRAITDIAVASSVGEYPLALVRTANSRAPSITGVFGTAGGWNHNYNWTMDDSPVAYSQNASPTKYTVNFPDGRVETFRAVTWDSVYRVRPGNDTPQTTSAGIRERFLQLNVSNMYAYLILPDGGAVEFRAQQYNDPAYGRWWYTYHVTGIYDPYGLKTTIDSEVVGSIRRITRVTEPAGRYLQFTYDANARRRITQVTEYINGVARRSVQYYYNLGWLTSVVYYGNSAWTARYQYTGPNVPDLPMLLSTCDDPMYPGPMKRIAYQYKPGGPTDPNNPDGTRPVYGQILRERYWDGVSSPTSGPMVSELTVGESPNITYKRKETRGDGDSRTFIYGGSYVTWVPDFMGHSAQQHYDATTKYIDYVVDRKGNRTDYTSDAITGNVTQIQLPLTNGDTTGQGNTRPTINYSYTNSYYVHTIQDEGGHTTTFTRNGNNRATRIDYPDGAYETLVYDSAHYNQISSHRMTTGGTETFAYDTRHRLQYYSDAYHANPGNPSVTYSYDSLDRVSGIADNLNHTTNFDYNDRGQLTLTTRPWLNGTRYTIGNAYNPDGTLQNKTDELGHVTSYTYDNYRRLKSVTPPVRGFGDSGTNTTNFYYGANPWDAPVADYYLTDSKVTWIVPPSSSFRKVQIAYDDNRRTSSVTAAPGTLAEATTSYTYDNAGNVTWVTNPLNHNNVHTLYDERNRPYSTSVGSHTSTVTYDTAGRPKEIDHPNGQVITYDTFDAMNRVTQQTVMQDPSPDAVSKFSYYTTADGANAPVGLLKTFKDPRLVQMNNGDAYTYSYDLMGRKQSLAYPHNSSTEQWSYDTVGRLNQFTNRAGKIQTFSYDQLNRLTGFTWNDNGTTPGVTFGYDAASRLTDINNVNATISRAYFNDNLLKSETETPTGGVSRTVSYTYNEDGIAATLGIPGYTFDYTYSNRNQVTWIKDHATGANQAYYEYDLRGNVTLRNAYTSPVIASNYSYDTYDRVTSVNHSLNNGSRTVNYHYDDANSSNNLLWAKRVITPTSAENNHGEAFSYDRADQAISFQLDVLNPDQVGSIPQKVFYDPNGNRTTFTSADTYDPTNNLNQYTNRTLNNHSYSSGYDATGNLTTSPEATPLGSTYDSQNRVKQASKNGVSITFKYDGLNRQVSRIVGGMTTYSTWSGWNLVEEYTNNPSLAIQARYLYGPTGPVKELKNNRYYSQDGSGSTALLTDSTAHLLEWYRYDLQGAPFFYGADDTQRNPNQSSYGVRHLFTGQQWYQEVGLYDLRNRFYSPDLGRFLQPDPIGFNGDPTNLYRYCLNNPASYADPYGLFSLNLQLGVGGSFGFLAGLGYVLHGGVGIGYNFNFSDPLASRPYIYGQLAVSVIGVGGVAAAGVEEGGGIRREGLPAGFAGDVTGHVEGGAGAEGLVAGGAADFSPSEVGGMITARDMGGVALYGGGGVAFNGYYGLPSIGDMWDSVFSSSGQPDPPPGGTTQVSGDCGPGCATVDRVIVRATFLESRFNQYSGYLPTTSTTNFYGGRAGLPGGGSPWDLTNQMGGLDPNAAFGHIMEGNPVGAMEGGLRLPIGLR